MYLIQRIQSRQCIATGSRTTVYFLDLIQLLDMYIDTQRECALLPLTCGSQSLSYGLCEWLYGHCDRQDELDICINRYDLL